MFSIHSRGEVPRVFWIEGITDDNFSGSIGSTLLEVITICYLIIIMAGTAGSFWAIRNFTVGGEWTSIESPKDNFFVQGYLGLDRDRIKKRN